MNQVASVGPDWGEQSCARENGARELEQSARLQVWAMVLTGRAFKVAIVSAAESGDESTLDEMCYAFAQTIISMSGGNEEIIQTSNHWVALAYSAARAFDVEIGSAAEEMDYPRMRDLAVELADLIERIYKIG